MTADNSPVVTTTEGMMMPGIDTVKVVYTYSIASMVIVGGLLFLYLSRNDPAASNTAALIPLISGFIGAAIQFVFNRETQATTAAQVAKATKDANVNAANVITAAIVPTDVATGGK